MSLVFASEASHILDVSSWEDIDMALMFLLPLLLLFGATFSEVSSLSAEVAKHHRHIPALLGFLSCMFLPLKFYQNLIIKTIFDVAITTIIL